MRRRLVLLLVVEVAAAVALRSALAVPAWHVDWSDPWGWAQTAPGPDVLAALLTHLGVALCAWLGLATLLYLAATLTRGPALLGAARVVTPRPFRRAFEGVATATLALQLVGQAAALAQPPGGGWSHDRGAVVAATASVATPPGAIPAAVLPSDIDAGYWLTAEDDNAWDIAAAALAERRGVDVADLRAADIVPYHQQLCDYIATHGRSGDPNLIFAGEEWTLPAFEDGGVAVATLAPPQPAPAAEPSPEPVPAEPPADSATPTVPAVEEVPASAPVTAAIAPEVAPPPTLAAASGAPARDEAPPAPPVVTGTQSGASPLLPAGLVVGGVVAALAASRRRARRRQAAGEGPAVSDGLLADLETVVRKGADLEGLEFLHLALRALCASLRNAGIPDLGIVGALVDDDGIRFRLSEPAVAVPPFHARTFPPTWILDRGCSQESLRQAAGDYPVAVPALVSLGYTADHTQVILNLEEPGIVSIVGDGADDVVRAAALGLATAPWAEMTNISAYGLDGLPASVRTVVDLGDELSRLGAAGAYTREVLVGTGCDNPVEARVTGEALEAWPTTVVLCAAGMDPEAVDVLSGLCSGADTPGVAALVAGPVPGAEITVNLASGGLVEPLGVTVAVAEAVTTRSASDLRAMLLEAATPQTAPLRLAPALPATGPPGRRVLVRVLGPVGVEVDGVEVSIERAKSLEALVFLALHRKENVDADRLRTALSANPDEPMTADVLYTRISELRRAVGVEFVPTMEGRSRHYVVSDQVVVDLQDLEAALANPSIDGLRDALAEVRGRPFTYTRGFEWTEAWWQGDATAMVVNAAHALYGLHRADGDTGLAQEALRQGLRACPDSELLRCDEMELASETGQPDRVEAVYDSLLATVEGDPAQLLPETNAQYQRLAAAT